jgi:ribosomal protein L5
MSDSDLVDLESRIKQLPGVLGCVILSNPDGSPSEIQAFARAGVESDALEGLIQAEITRTGADASVQHIHVFELDAESVMGDRDSLRQAADEAQHQAEANAPSAAQQALRSELHELQSHGPFPGSLEKRPILQRVILSSTTAQAEAEVSLRGTTEHVVGAATGEKTAYGLAVVAEATLKACAELVPGFDVDLRGASLVTVVGEQAVVALVRVRGYEDLMGCALLRNGPASDATVRATLDAVNRVLTVSEA